MRYSTNRNMFSPDGYSQKQSVVQDILGCTSFCADAGAHTEEGYNMFGIDSNTTFYIPDW